MSSAEEEHARSSKKRRVHRACENCRRKKSKCDGPEQPDFRCSRCVARRVECTYADPFVKIYANSYVASLENRLARMEQLLEELCLDNKMPEEAARRLSEHQKSAYANAPEGSRDPGTNPVRNLTVAPQKPGDSEEYGSSSDDDRQEVLDGLRDLSLNSQVYRYHGKSSGLVLLRSAIDIQEEYTKGRREKPERNMWLRPTLIEDLPIFTDFPPDDLLNTLVTAYFRNINDYIPLLHEPTFRNGLADGLHRRHGTFGGTVLLVCANGSRFTKDPRVYPVEPEEWQSAGWMWYEQVQRARRLPLEPVQLYDLQIYALMVMFVPGGRAPHATWPLIGVGIRMGIDVGVHRRRRFGATPTVEGELWRRVFWVLVYLEWASAYGLGRPASIHAEEMDLEQPLEVDDEYWTTSEGEPFFDQPPEKPSKVSSFVYMIRLSYILAFASRTIYSTNQTKARLSHGNLRWEEHIVAELDSALNKWLDSLPAHLRWGLNCEDVVTLTQAATLRAHHYHLQIVVHRPFISAARRDSPLAFSSLLICTNAARSAIQVVYALFKRTGSPHHLNMGNVFVSSLIMIMNVMGQERVGKPYNASRDLECVMRGREMLDAMKHEQPVCVTLCKLLDDMLDAANAPPKSQEPLQEKSSHISDGSLKTPQPQSREVFTGTTRNPPSSVTSSTQQQDVTSPKQSSSSITPSFDTPLGRNMPVSSSEGSQQHSDCVASILPTAFADGDILSTTHSALLKSQDYATASLEDTTPVGTSNPAALISGQFGDFVYPQSGVEMLGFGQPVLSPPTATVTEAARPTSIPRHSSSALDSAMVVLFGLSATPSGDEMHIESDFALVDDAMEMWANAPPAFGLDEWRAYIDSTTNRNYNSNGT